MAWEVACELRVNSPRIGFSSFWGVPGSRIWGGLGSQPKKYWFSFKIYYEKLLFLLWATDLDLWGGCLGPFRSYIFSELELQKCLGEGPGAGFLWN